MVSALNLHNYSYLQIKNIYNKQKTIFLLFLKIFLQLISIKFGSNSVNFKATNEAFYNVLTNWCLYWVIRHCIFIAAWTMMLLNNPGFYHTYDIYNNSVVIPDPTVYFIRKEMK